MLRTGHTMISPQLVTVIVASAAIAVFAGLLLSALVKRRKRKRQRDEERYRMLAESVPNLMWTATPDGSVDYCNARFAEYAQQPGSALAARGAWHHLVHDADRNDATTAWRTAVASGTPYRAEARLRRHDGSYRWHVMLALPMREPDGEIVKWFGSCTDIQDHKDAERIFTVLADITQALASSLDPVEIARTLSALIVPGEAAYCEVQLLGEDGRLATVAAAGDPKTFGRKDAERAERAQRAGATLLTRRLSAVPVCVGDELLGWLICCEARDDVRALVPELASRLGSAIANAKAYEREHRVATTFQRAALGPALPDVPGMRFFALYQAARAEASVGGDWYDAFRLPDGRVVISIGDVAGSGLDAAVTMGSVRQSIRTAVLINPNPVSVLDAVDRIVRAMGRDRFVTAFVGVLDPVVGELTFANAGHPPPLLRFASGRVGELAHGDLPLGLRQRNSAPAVVIPVEAGSLILAYTDGLTEFDRDAVAGQAKVAQALERSNGDDVAREIFDAVSAGRPERDDIAILAVAFDAPLTAVDHPTCASRWTFDVADARLAADARAACLQRLRDIGFDEGELAAAELVFGELVGNVYRYADGMVEIMLDTSGAAAVLHVLDRGNGFELRPRLPVDLLAERGRGLFLVNTFADEFSIERRRTGGSHVRAVLVGATRGRGDATMARTTL
jgi:PAS domain S-box-containing protein